MKFKLLAIYNKTTILITIQTEFLYIKN